ncbi:hypothetical protein B484DRAFT_322353, partial [Ochromonadaceae sp. CCMP2298]
IIHHEAGHFLVAYLLGVPVRGCVTNAWDALKYVLCMYVCMYMCVCICMYMYACICVSQKVTRSSLDRLSVVTMAGIAAEAIKFGNAEGGLNDERSLLGLLSTSISPPWSILRIQGQARWAVLQAIQLIRQHPESYNAVVEALQRGAGVGDVVCAIEQNLPASLPSKTRTEQREAR